MAKTGDNVLKKAELAARRALARRLARPGGARLVEAPENVAEWGERPKLLLLRQDKIGDALITVPVLRALRRRFPEARMDILLGEANFSIGRALGEYVDSALKYEKNPLAIPLLLRELRRRRYDAVIDLMDNASATSTALVRFCGARYAIGINKRNAAVYSHVTPLADTSQVHIVERIASLLLPFGIDPGEVPLDLEYRILPEERSRAAGIFPRKQGQFLVGLNLSSASPTRMWGDEQWIALARLLAEQLPWARLAGFSAPAERPQLLRLAAAAPVTPAPAVAAFHDFAVLLSACDGVITPDTSAVHLAAGWKTPCVAMFVRSNPDALPWTPYRSPHRSLYAAAAISEIAPAAVAAAAEELFAEHRNHRREP